MLTIWKYELSSIGVNEVEMPKSSIVRHVGISPTGIMDSLCVWCEVNTENPLVKEQFYVVGTGQEIPKNIFNACTFVGTAITDDGFVWHVYWGYHGSDLKTLELENAVKSMEK